MLSELRAKAKITASANVKFHKNVTNKHVGAIVQPCRALSKSTSKVFAIGASTGRTEAIRQMMSQFPASALGVVIVQHMPQGFCQINHNPAANIA